MSVTPPPPGAAALSVPIVGAIAESAQYDRARAAFRSALGGFPVQDVRLSGRIGPPLASADVRSPQRFVTHPKVTDALESTSVATEVSMPHLPGRPAPAGWDGEPGAGAPYGVA